MLDKYKLNILFFIVDCLRADHLGCYGYTVDTSPGINELSKKSLLFKRAYACINQTDMSLTSIFSGKYPLTHGIVQPGTFYSNQELKQLPVSSFLFLPQILKTYGYNTYGFDWLGLWHKWGYDYYEGDKKERFLKFNSVSSTSIVKSAIRIGAKLSKRFGNITDWITGARKPGLDAKIIADQVIKAIRHRNVKKPFYMMAHFWDPHTPLNPPQNFLNKMKNQTFEKNCIQMDKILNEIPVSRSRKQWLEQHIIKECKTLDEFISKYDACIAWVDYQFSRIANFLEESELMNETIIIITGDHGENLWDHEYFCSHDGVYDTVLHIPLIIRHPFYSGKKIEAIVSHVDIVPTLLDMLKFQTNEIFDGATILPLLENDNTEIHHTIFFQSRKSEGKKGIRTKRFKYIESIEGNVLESSSSKSTKIERQELYDLLNDPCETNNLVEEKAEITMDMQKKLNGIVNAQLQNAERILVRRHLTALKNKLL